MIQQPLAVWRDVAQLLTAQSRRLTREVGVIAAPPTIKCGPRQIAKPRAAVSGGHWHDNHSA